MNSTTAGILTTTYNSKTAMSSTLSEYSKNLLDHMVTKYKENAAKVSDTDEYELEIRFRGITRDSFESVYNNIVTDPEFTNATLETTVNVISANVYERSARGRNDETQYIRKITFEGSSPISDTYHTKLRMMKPVIIDSYTKYAVGLSKESKSRKFATSTNALVRFKVRITFDYIPSGSQGTSAQWRFDLTAIKFGSLTDLGASLKTIKKELFTDKLKVKNFISELNFDMIDNYEIEVEHIGKAGNLTADDISVAEKVFTLINPNYVNEIMYQNEIFHVAQYLITNNTILKLFKEPSHRLKQLGNQVVALSKDTYYSSIYPPTGYFATLKYDGQRAVISIIGDKCRILKSDEMIEIAKNGISKKFRGGADDDEVTIVDVEIVLDSQKVGGGKNTKEQKEKTAGQMTFHIFDVMVIRDENISDTSFENRITFIPGAVKLLEDIVYPQGKVLAKTYVRLGDKLETDIRGLWETKDTIPRDGIIITEPSDGYRATKNYKWKPYEQNTIDFLAVKCPQKLLGITPFITAEGKDLYLLFVGITHQMREKLGIHFLQHYRHMFPTQEGGYFPIQFSPSANPLAFLYYHDKSSEEQIDKQIIELSRNTDNTEWIFDRIRTDRKFEKNYFGNDFRIAELTYSNYIDPFRIEDLWRPSNLYFSKTSANRYRAKNGYMRFVISVLINKYLKGAKWVIDEAAGRGADLHRYHEIGVENGLFMDISPTAITELIQRKYSFFANKKRHVAKWVGGADAGIKADLARSTSYNKLVNKTANNLTIHTLVADLKSPQNDLVASTFQFGLNTSLVDGVVCNLAFHYMCDTLEHMRNLLTFNARMLKVGGVFIFIVMDGKKVFDLLAPLKSGQTWEMKEDGLTKYAIKKKYTGATISPAGQTISVLLPFTDEMMDEPLCNIKAVTAEATKLGFKSVDGTPASDLLDDFARANKSMSEQLTDIDNEYIGLHKYVVFQKMKELAEKKQ